MVFAFYLLISIAGICIEWPITKSLKAYTPADVVFPPDPRWAYIVATVITAGILLYILLYVRPHVLFTRNRPVPLYDPDAEQPESGVEGFLQHLRAKGGVDRGGFECNCGAEMCRGEILGRLFSPPLGAKKAAAAAACAAVGAGAASSS